MAIDSKRIQELSKLVSKFGKSKSIKKPMVSPYVIKSGTLSLKDMSDAISAISKYSIPEPKKTVKIQIPQVLVPQINKPVEQGVDTTLTRNELTYLIQSLIIQPRDGKTPTVPELISLFRKFIVMPQDGKTPTDDDLIGLITPLIPPPIKGKDGLDGIDGINGIDGRDGIDGKDGKSPIPGIDFEIGSSETPESIANKLNTLTKVIEGSVIKGFVTLDQIIPAVIKELKTGKNRLEAKDITNLPQKQYGKKIDTSDLRWHGSGLSEVSHDTTLTGNGTPSSPLSVVSSASFTGAQEKTTTPPNSIITTFTFDHAPKVIFWNGAFQTLTDDYTVSGPFSITFTASAGVPLTNDKVVNLYA